MPRKTEFETPQQEAERLYPLTPELGEFDVANVQQAAHITAARMYMGEVDKYRKALGEIQKLADEPLTTAEAKIFEIATEALKTNTHG